MVLHQSIGLFCSQMKIKVMLIKVESDANYEQIQKQVIIIQDQSIQNLKSIN